MTLTQHELLSASAGTGKTHQLTSRYLRLLFGTGQAERIVALTFTRKAAAEFFFKIFQRLADGAESAAGAAKLSGELGIIVDMDACRRQLRALLDQLHRLQLSTYDSFFSRIVQTFPFELGLAGPPTLLDHQQQVQAIQQAQDALSRRTNVDREFLGEFWYACRRATMGAETKTISQIVEDFVQQHHSLYFEAREARCWGDARVIWGGACPWECLDLNLEVEALALQEALPWETLKPKQQAFWREYLTQLLSWRPPVEMPARIEYFTKKFLEVYPSLDTGHAEVTVHGKQTLSAAVGASVKRITCFCFWKLLQPRLEATQGIYDVMRLFEQIYATEVRQVGRITLEDATRLLANGAHGHGLADPELRETLGYRLDGWFDHWLLDEFQDTSHAQWAAIADLIDEVIQDAQGQRSFFAVGDPKQSIYRWRGSDDRLFERVAQRYQAALQQRTMAESYRSVPAVLDMVNRVFSDSSQLAEVTSLAVAERWRRGWAEHRSAAHLRTQTGCACLIHAPVEDESCFATVLALLQEIQPLSRGLTVAVLTRENSTAEALVDHLRWNGGPACSLAANVHAGRDSVVAAGLRSLLTVAAHPADSQAWIHLRMTPVGGRMEQDFASAAALSADLLRRWGEGGLTALVDVWREWCAPHLDPTDAFSRERLDSCRRAAVALDQSGEADLDAFIAALERLELREHDVPGQVAVMTVHKAKGLDWDVVLLTDLDGNTLSERRKGQLEVQRGADGAVEWICDLPSSAYARHEPVLGARIVESEDDAAFERLCALYVGMTRAKRGLFVVTHAAKGSSPNYFKLLDTTLAATPADVRIGQTHFTGAWTHGDLAWFEGFDQQPAREPKVEPLPVLALTERRHDRSPRPVQPSGQADRSRRLALGLNPEARQFGTAVHEGLARVEWLPDHSSDAASAVDAAVTGLPDEVAIAVRRVLTSPETRPLFVRHGAWTHVWREMPFECIQGDAWISGRFDRVLLERDATGQVVAALLIDFKTTGPSGRLEPAAYEPQLNRYREVLSTLCALPASAITAAVVVVQPERVELRHVLAGAREAPEAVGR
jgi:ATP-dependent helicase/nuclease subunit A